MNRFNARRAVTLTEVLIAIFLMGIGLMAILSLFPLGASQMAQALQDQRAAEAATTASGFARVIWKQAVDADPNVGQAKFYDVNGNPQSAQRFVQAMDNPSYNSANTQFCIGTDQGGTPGQPPPYAPTGPNAMPAMPRTGLNSAAGSAVVSATGASYPVFVDPIGWQANSGNQSMQWWLPQPPSGGVPAWNIPRRPLYVPPTTPSSSNTSWMALSPSNFGTLQPILKQFSLMDDMTFNFAGTPDLDGDPSTPDSSLTSSQGVRRAGRYSWAYMFRRSNNADRTAVDITTILYSGRSIDVPSLETAYLGAGAIGNKGLTLYYNPSTQTKPALRRGAWVLDATLWDANGNVAPQGIFYRVVNVDDSVTGQIALELQTPLLGGPSQPLPLASGSPMRSIVVMERVIEVFTKKDVTSVAPPMPY
jgi:Tfp pilus assembly protein PilV